MVHFDAYARPRAREVGTRSSGGVRSSRGTL
jgi:hypothetical protein